MIEYEALGRYTAFKEETERWARERNGLLSQLKSIIQSVTGYEGSSACSYGFNNDKAADLLSRAAHANMEMLSAMSQMNAAAADCGKPVVKVITRQ